MNLNKLVTIIVKYLTKEKKKKEKNLAPTFHICAFMTIWQGLQFDLFDTSACWKVLVVTSTFLDTLNANNLHMKEGFKCGRW